MFDLFLKTVAVCEVFLYFCPVNYNNDIIKILYLLLCILVFVSFESCHRDNDETNVDVSVMTGIQEDAITFLNDQFSSGQDFETAVNNCVQRLMQNQEVESAYVQDENQVIVKYKSGVTGVIYLINDIEEHKTLEKKPINTESFKQAPKWESDNGITLIKNHKVLLWQPFENEECPAADSLNKIFMSCPDISFEVNTITGTGCTMKSLYNLTQYGFVYIYTHGGMLNDGTYYIVTKDPVNPGTGFSMDDLKKSKILIVTCGNVQNVYINNHEVVICENKGHWFGVTAAFLSKYESGTFKSPSIVYITACKSLVNNSFANYFVNEKGASVYFGFDNIVTDLFGYEVALEFVRNMLNEKLDVYSAYKKLEKTIDPYPVRYNNNGVDVLVYYHAELKDHGFENPTYFPTGYVDCPALKKRWKLTDVVYFPDPYQGTNHFSQLQLHGSDFRIIYRLSKKNQIANDIYRPYVINDIDADILWENFIYSNSTHFLTGTYSDYNNSTFWRAPEANTHRIVKNAGQLKHQKQNGVNTLTFDFTGDDGYSYYGAFIGEIQQ